MRRLTLPALLVSLLFLLAACGPRADVTDPSISLDTPAAGSEFIAGETIEVTGTASDAVGITAVTIQLNDGAAEAATYSGGEFTYSLTAPAEGTHTLTATARDAAGNTATDTVTFSTIEPDGAVTGQLEIVPPMGSARPDPAPADASRLGDLDRPRGQALQTQPLNLPQLNRVIVTMTSSLAPIRATGVDEGALQAWTNEVGSLAADFAAEGVTSAHGLIPELGIAVLEIAPGRDVAAAVSALSADRRVLTAEPDSWVFSHAQPDAEVVDLFDLQWAHEIANAQVGWEVTTDAPEVIVAVIDTGLGSPIGNESLAETHPGLVPNLIGGFDFVSSFDLTPLPEDPADPVFEELVALYPQLRYLDGDLHDGWDPHPYDEINTVLDDGLFVGLDTFGSHGTHVAGIVGASTETARSAGVAWNVKIQPIRVLGHFGGGATSDVLAGVAYAAGITVVDPIMPRVIYTNPTPAHVINMSLGGGAWSDAGAALYSRVSDRGVLVVASAGNSATDIVNYPAGYDGVLSVSSLDYIQWAEEAGGPAAVFTDNFSNFGSTVDISAPGGIAWTTAEDYESWNGAGFADAPFILSTGWEWYGASGERSDTPIYYFSAGTSMAAPYVAGAAALLLGLDASLDAAALTDILTGTARRVDDSFLEYSYGDPEADWDPFYGYGAIDLPAAIAAVQSGDIQRFTPTTYVEAEHTDSGQVIRVEANADLSFEIDDMRAGEWHIRAGVATDTGGDIGEGGQYYGELDSPVTVEEDGTISGDVSFILQRLP